MRQAIIVDMDGTLALFKLPDGTMLREPFGDVDYSSDCPNPMVVKMVRMWSSAGYDIVVVTGREGTPQGRKQTEAWLAFHGVPTDALFFRGVKDYRKDAEVKKEIYEGSIKHQWEVHLVMDDRDQVVEMWRSLGLVCWQVAPGDF